MTTIGITLELPDPWATDLQQYRLSLGDTSGEGIPAHITLLGPVDVVPELLDDVLGHLAKVVAAQGCFSVRLQGADSFRPVSPVVFVHVEEGGESCAALAEAVRSGPLGFDWEYPYHAHVTIAHGVEDSVLDRAEREFAGFGCEFTVDHIRVYHHQADEGWLPLTDLPLFAGC